MLKAIAAIQAGTTQKEILRALLDNSVHYSGRGALFVIKAGAATGWQGRGFSHGEDPIKDFALDVSTGAPEQALQSRMPCSGPPTRSMPNCSRFGGPADDRVLVLPLVLKEKVAALVYADAGIEAGQNGCCRAGAAGTSASAWLEVTSLRKHARKKKRPRRPVEKAESAAKRDRPPRFRTLLRRMLESMPPRRPPGRRHPARLCRRRGSGSVGGTPVHGDPPTPEDADVHRKAQRFARLLVDEIKLYNQVKVAEGRKNKDLYDRLKEDIEKSRATFQKRYGNTPVRR